MSKDIQIESNYQTHLKELYWELIFPAHKWSVLNVMWKKKIINCLFNLLTLRIPNTIKMQFDYEI